MAQKTSTTLHPAQKPQHQDKKPGEQSKMIPEPLIDDPAYHAAGKLEDKVALITGGDSGIGSAVAVLYAKEGADVTIVYFNEEEDAQNTKRLVEKYGRQCLLLRGDLKSKGFCEQVINDVVKHYGKLDILVNNAALQYECQSIEDIDLERVEETFQTNILPMFYLTRPALKHLKAGACVINTTSVTAFKGSPHLLDYSSTKGAIETFTYSLSGQLAEKGIRVNAVAPGPIWTPLIPDTFSEKDVAEFGQSVPMKRAGQPSEVAPCYVFLASTDSSYMTGQILHPNGGTIVH